MSDEILHRKEAENPKDKRIEKKEVSLPDLAEVLETLNPEQREEMLQVMASCAKHESFRGPIPHPELLKGYEEIQAGFAERIMRMAEKEQERRFDREMGQEECEKKIIDNTASESKRGQCFALIVAVLFLVGSVVLALFGHDAVAGILGGGTLASIVAVFITGRKSATKIIADPES